MKKCSFLFVIASLLFSPMLMTVALSRGGLVSSTPVVSIKSIAESERILQEDRPHFVRNILVNNYHSMENSNSISTDVNFNTTNDNDNVFDSNCIYYFGVGSNMLRSKLENRGINGSTIEILSMEPAVVKGHRLAFNMRGFPPLEPGMGGLEPVESDSKPLYAYNEPECHGALVKVTIDNYEKIMRSEGVGLNTSNPSRRPGYEEVVVTAIPYNKSKAPVLAVALRARSHARLKLDAKPSTRYINILKEGAKELNLNESYQKFLEQHPVQVVPKLIKRLAINNLIFMSVISANSFQGGKRSWISKVQSWLLFRVYIRSASAISLVLKISDLLTALILLPGGLMGLMYRFYCSIRGKQLSPMTQRFVKLLE